MGCDRDNAFQTLRPEKKTEEAATRPSCVKQGTDKA